MMMPGGYCGDGCCGPRIEQREPACAGSGDHKAQGHRMGNCSDEDHYNHNDNRGRRYTTNDGTSGMVEERWPGHADRGGHRH